MKVSRIGYYNYLPDTTVNTYSSKRFPQNCYNNNNNI